MSNILKYMVEFEIPDPFPMELVEMIPDQRKAVHLLFLEERLLTYTLASDRSKVWGIFLAAGESELINYIERLPMSRYLHYDYTLVLFHETMQHIPAMSLN